jgi:leucyl/phenylalanyl-tRNA--protein transferase
VALYHLFQHLKLHGFVLFDIQMLTPITAALGGVNISRKDYLRRLERAMERTCAF